MAEPSCARGDSTVGIWHALVGVPSRWMVHAPHAAIPQPVFGADKAQRVAEHPSHRRVRRDAHGVGLAVDLQ